MPDTVKQFVWSIISAIGTTVGGLIVAFFSGIWDDLWSSPLVTVAGLIGFIFFVICAYELIKAGKPTNGFVVTAFLLGVLGFGIGWLGLFTAAQAKIAAAQAKNVDGLKREWPDAIRCSWPEPGKVTNTDWIFLYRGSAIRNTSGIVQMYFLVGAGYSEQFKSFPHELWFRENGALVLPTEITVNADAESQRYKEYFLPGDLDCGGKKIADIKSNGHAYVFAKIMR